jgi:hypothetical protein
MMARAGVVVFTLGKRGEKQEFFFEKKNQKTFIF